MRDETAPWWEALLLLVVMACVTLGVTTYAWGLDGGRKERTAAIAADLAEQGYTLQRVETVGEGARWMVVAQ